MNPKSILLIAVFLILVGLGGLLFLIYNSPGYVKPLYGKNIKTGFQSNGERIYYTGYDSQGERIRTTYGPAWLYMHGGSCVDCHGVDGKGGVPVMMGTAIPPDITYKSLTSGHDEENQPYTDKTIKIAIRDGLEPNGEPLDPTMPRWQMSNSDLNDLVEYLKTL